MEAKIIRVENMVNVPVRTVVFKDYDEETVLKTEYVHDGDCAAAPTDPTREGYKFTGRTPDFSESAPVRADATYVATYEEDKE